jgi:hypothetical protein
MPRRGAALAIYVRGRRTRMYAPDDENKEINHQIISGLGNFPFC